MAHRTSELLRPLKADGIVPKKSELPGSMLLENRIQNQCSLGSTVRLYGRLSCAPRSDRGLLPHHLLHLLTCFIQPHTYSSSPVKKPVVLELLPHLLALAVHMTTLQTTFHIKIHQIIHHFCCIDPANCNSVKWLNTVSSLHSNLFHLQYLFHFYSRANIIQFFLTAHRLLDTCAWQMESELSLTASFIPDGLNYFITINDTPSASCAALPDVQRPQSHSLR